MHGRIHVWSIGVWKSGILFAFNVLGKPAPENENSTPNGFWYDFLMILGLHEVFAAVRLTQQYMAPVTG